MTIIEAIFDKLLFRPLFRDLKTWTTSPVLLKAIFGLPMTDSEFEIFKKHTGRTKMPTKPFKEVYLLIGRRGGKSFLSALVAVFMGVFVPWPLGIELGYIMIIAVDLVFQRG